NAVLATEDVPAPVDEVTLRVSLDALKQRLCAFKARFVDAETGAPIENVLVSLDDVQSGAPGQKTAADGTGQIQNVRPGLVQLGAEGPRDSGFERLHQTVRFVSGETLDMGTIRLAKAVTIDGTLVDADGKPVRGGVTMISLDRRDPTLDLDSNHT